MARDPRSFRSLLACFAAAAALIAFAPSGAAKTSRKASYPYERVWPTSVRFLRVDQGLEILEKDESAGYVLFTIEEDGDSYRGALELLRRKDGADRDSVEILLHIENRPDYMEHALLDKLLQKLRRELGLPEAPKRKKPEQKPDDDGGDKKDTSDGDAPAA